MALKMDNQRYKPYKWSQNPAHNWCPLCVNSLVHSCHKKKTNAPNVWNRYNYIWTALWLSVINFTASISISPPSNNKQWWRPEIISIEPPSKKKKLMAGQPTATTNLTQKLQVFPPVTNGSRNPHSDHWLHLAKVSDETAAIFSESTCILYAYINIYIYVYVCIHVYIYSICLLHIWICLVIRWDICVCVFGDVIGVFEVK